MNSKILKVVEDQSAVISIQAGVINELFQLLGQYMSAEELDALPQVARINRAAQLVSENGQP